MDSTPAPWQASPQGSETPARPAMAPASGAPSTYWLDSPGNADGSGVTPTASSTSANSLVAQYVDYSGTPGTTTGTFAEA